MGISSNTTVVRPELCYDVHPLCIARRDISTLTIKTTICGRDSIFHLICSLILPPLTTCRSDLSLLKRISAARSEVYIIIFAMSSKSHPW